MKKDKTPLTKKQLQGILSSEGLSNYDISYIPEDAAITSYQLFKDPEDRLVITYSSPSETPSK